jgi:selenocysteine lyase/cysteine desulfurase
VFRLLGIPNTDIENPEVSAFDGMVRISLGVYNTDEEVDALLDAVRKIAEK